MYDTFILLPPDSSITTDAIEAALRTSFEASVAPALTRNGTTLRLAWGGFTLTLARNADPSVQEESVDMASDADPAMRARIGSCSARVEIAGTTDPDMNHFNDYCAAVQAIEALGEVYTFDPASGEFTNLPANGIARN